MFKRYFYKFLHGITATHFGGACIGPTDHAIIVPDAVTKVRLVVLKQTAKTADSSVRSSQSSRRTCHCRCGCRCRRQIVAARRRRVSVKKCRRTFRCLTFFVVVFRVPGHVYRAFGGSQAVFVRHLHSGFFVSSSSSPHSSSRTNQKNYYYYSTYSRGRKTTMTVLTSLSPPPPHSSTLGSGECTTVEHPGPKLLQSTNVDMEKISIDTLECLYLEQIDMASGINRDAFQVVQD